MSNHPQHLYEFGPFRLDTAERLLMREGEAIALTPKVYETLIVLVERRGRLVGKEELMEAIWPEDNVEEANLTNNVSVLRKKLGEGQNGQHYIETVPKHGYKFVARVTEMTNVADALMIERRTLTRIVTSVVEDDGAAELDIAPLHSPSEAYSVVAAAPPLLPPPHIPTFLQGTSTLGGATSHRTATVIAVGLLFLVAMAAVLFRPETSPETSNAKTAAHGRTKLRSLAVLPFKTIGAEPEISEYLGIGVSDALITTLGNSQQIVVRPTSAIRRYADPRQDPVAAGHEQGVEAVLDGSVQRAGDRIRVSVQLLRTRDGASLWSAKFDERFTDIFAVQDSISRQVARELLVELNPEEAKRLRRRGSENIFAYEAYLKGLYFWNKRTKEGYKKSLGFFQQAIDRDPTYAEAYVGLSNSYSFRGGLDRASAAEDYKRSRAAVERALEIDETLPEVHATLGLFAMNFDWNWIEAEKEYKRAIELNPNYATAHQWYGEFLACMGRFDEGLAEAKRAQELDPLSLIINTDVAKVYMFARRYDEAIEQYRRVLDMDPQFEVAHGLLALTYSMKGMTKEAVAELRQIKNLEDDPMYMSFLAFVHGKAGRRGETQRVLDRMSELSKRVYVSPLWMAFAYAGQGDRERAFQWLDRVFDERPSGGTISLKVGDAWDNLRPDPRFPLLLSRAGF
jgi:DNA-binding winged helix-turn-helix (wHTH) protein/TolB-like protein/Flp pilus assembly protein TadD